MDATFEYLKSITPPEILRHCGNARVRLERIPRCQPAASFCSTESDLDRRSSKAIQQGAEEYIMKPFDAEILCEKLVAVGVLARLS